MSSNTLSFEGCNFLRQRLILSTLSGRPVKIKKIRSKDDNPGLKGSFTCQWSAISMRNSAWKLEKCFRALAWLCFCGFYCHLADRLFTRQYCCTGLLNKKFSTNVTQGSHYSSLKIKPVNENKSSTGESKTPAIVQISQIQINFIVISGLHDMIRWCMDDWFMITNLPSVFIIICREWMIILITLSCPHLNLKLATIELIWLHLHFVFDLATAFRNKSSLSC
jgi:hypothetical protein